MRKRESGGADRTKGGADRTEATPWHSQQQDTGKGSWTGLRLGAQATGQRGWGAEKSGREGAPEVRAYSRITGLVDAFPEPSHWLDKQVSNMYRKGGSRNRFRSYSGEGFEQAGRL